MFQDVLVYPDIPYLREQIIPYIGNKRRLLPLIFQSMRSVFPEGFAGKRFLDLFAGSGSVSRLARCLGFTVYANDWEQYAYVLNHAYLEVNRGKLDGMFGRWGGLRRLLDTLNSLPHCGREQEYVARFYSPRDDRNPDYRTERLFYTRHNGLRIDTIRTWIEQAYPGEPVEHDRRREKHLLLALLLHQAAIHTNASGVFKAFHKGFGGFSGDALGRIMKPIALPFPVLVDSPYPARVFRREAGRLLREELAGVSFDLAYLDPPYNQHQYGSNYHLLNTIALWDKPLLREPPGGKAAIRKDWVKTRSDYCYRHRAEQAFAELLELVRARVILVSYSTEGIIPFDRLIRLCAARGKVSLHTNRYVTYRGGRQSARRQNNTIEFVAVIETGRRSSGADLRLVEDAIRERELSLQLKKSYRSAALEERFILDRERGSIGMQVDGATLWIRTRGLYTIDEPDLIGRVEALAVSPETKRRIRTQLLENLQQCECRDRTEELEELLGRAERGDGEELACLLPSVLRKIAHKKY
ncbi:MAG: DNA adenine methylase, partial [Spirochaetota bacterium]